MVIAYRLDHLTLDRWIAEAESAVEREQRR
jgi:hypothetical protein